MTDPVHGLLAEVRRGDTVESVHAGSIAIVDDAGRLHGQVGDPAAVVFSRSTLKPFQALPLVAHPRLDSLDLAPSDIAICCASHSGEPVHVARVQALLDRIGATEADLACGTHVPLHHETLGTHPEAGARFSPLQHNCSGKHAGMLALARLLDAPFRQYLDPGHPVQARIRAAVAHCTRVASRDLISAIDGCSAPNYAMPLQNLARAYAWLARPPAGDPFARAAARIREAILAHPELVGGSRRLDTRLMQALGGQCLSKSGAEAVHCLALPDAGLGVAVKVADGSPRALGCIVVALLRQLGVPASADGLEDLVEIPLHNARGRQVGSIRPAFSLEAA